MDSWVDGYIGGQVWMWRPRKRREGKTKASGSRGHLGKLVEELAFERLAVDTWTLEGIEKTP